MDRLRHILRHNYSYYGLLHTKKKKMQGLPTSHPLVTFISHKPA